MPRFVSAPRGVWRLVARAQRLGFSEGFRGKGGGWIALGVAAWGLQRVRTAAGAADEVLIREGLAAGQSITITNTGVSRAEARKVAKQAQKRVHALDRRLARDLKASRRRAGARADQRRIDEAAAEIAAAHVQAEEAAAFARVGRRKRRR